MVFLTIFTIFLVNMALRKVVGLRWYSYFNLEAIYQTQERKSVLSGCFFVSACIFERKSLIEVIGHPNSLAHLTSHFFFFLLLVWQEPFHTA